MATVEKVETPDPAKEGDHGTVTVRLDCGNTVDVRLLGQSYQEWNELKAGDTVEVTSAWNDHITDNTMFPGYVKLVPQLVSDQNDLSTIQS